MNEAAAELKATVDELGRRWSETRALDAAGDWYVRFRSTAGLLTAGEQKLVVRPTAFTTP